MQPLYLLWFSAFLRGKALISTVFSTVVENSWEFWSPSRGRESTTAMETRSTLTRFSAVRYDACFPQFVLTPIRESHEAHVSTQSPPSSPDPRVSGQDAHEERPHRFEAPAPEGPEAPHGFHPVSTRADAGRGGMTLKFGRAVRLRSRDQFDRVQQGGRRVSARFITLIGSPNGLEFDRLGIIASRRVGGAVLRNRAKRRIRELFRRRESAGVVRPLDLVAIARQSIVDAPFQAVEADFRSALIKLRGVKFSS